MAEIAQQLPIDLWARVAVFLPGEDRIHSFWSLRMSGLMRASFLDWSHFFSDVIAENKARAVYEAEVECHWPSLDALVCDDDLRLLTEMGIDPISATRALIECGGNVEFAIHRALQNP